MHPSVAVELPAVPQPTRMVTTARRNTMIVRTKEELAGTERDMNGPGWRSVRLILRDDGMGCSVHDTTVREGTEMHLQYKNHFETNYCVGGEGEVVDVATGRTFPISPGTVYALDQHDQHILRALRGDLKLVCVFTPPLSGRETHKDGGYAID
jgi:L-ectoine synthase